MKERMALFGDNDRLSGIFTPAADAPRGCAAIFPNAGIVHRIGPNRLHVKLARHLAEAGIDCLRFDQSGLGESPAAPPGRSHEEQAVEDLRAAIDHVLATAGERDIVIAGLCSGADDGYRTALANERVRGLVLLDPYAYENRSAQMRDAWRKAQDTSRWQRKAKRMLSRGQNSEPAALAADAAIPEEDEDSGRPLPPREEFGADLQTLCRRGVAVNILYTSAERQKINRPEQFFQTFRAFDFGEAMTVNVWTDVDHIFSEQAAQTRLASHLGDWLTSRWSR